MDEEEAEFPQQQAFVIKNQSQSELLCALERFDEMRGESVSSNNDQMAGPLYVRALTNPESHLTVEGKINSIPAHSLVDSGATGIFMNPQFAQQCRAEVILKMIPREVRVIDGRMINSGLITHEARVELNIGGHREVLVADITNT